MGIEQAAIFLASSVLISLGLLALVAVAIVVNNLISKYWKPVRVFTQDSFWVFGKQAEEYYINNHPEVVAAKKKELDKSNEPSLK